MRDDEWIELHRKAAPDERLTVTGAAILFMVVSFLILVAVRISPPNTTIQNDSAVRHLTER
jgi:hypothetical protein